MPPLCVFRLCDSHIGGFEVVWHSQCQPIVAEVSHGAAYSYQLFHASATCTWIPALPAASRAASRRRLRETLALSTTRLVGRSAKHVFTTKHVFWGKRQREQVCTEKYIKGGAKPRYAETLSELAWRRKKKKKKKKKKIAHTAWHIARPGRRAARERRRRRLEKRAQGGARRGAAERISSSPRPLGGHGGLENLIIIIIIIFFFFDRVLFSAILGFWKSAISAIRWPDRLGLAFLMNDVPPMHMY
jgi:hypothetical protein